MHNPIRCAVRIPECHHTFAPQVTTLWFHESRGKILGCYHFPSVPPSREGNACLQVPAAEGIYFKGSQVSKIFYMRREQCQKINQSESFNGPLWVNAGKKQMITFWKRTVMNNDVYLGTALNTAQRFLMDCMLRATCVRQHATRSATRQCSDFVK